MMSDLAQQGGVGAEEREGPGAKHEEKNVGHGHISVRLGRRCGAGRRKGSSGKVGEGRKGSIKMPTLNRRPVSTLFQEKER